MTLLALILTPTLTTAERPLSGRRTVGTRKRYALPLPLALSVNRTPNPGPNPNPNPNPTPHPNPNPNPNQARVVEVCTEMRLVSGAGSQAAFGRL